MSDMQMTYEYITSDILVNAIGIRVDTNGTWVT